MCSLYPGNEKGRGRRKGEGKGTGRERGNRKERCISLIPRPGEGGEKTYFPLFVHALNGGVKYHRHIRQLIYDCDVTMGTKHYMVRIHMYYHSEVKRA